MACNLLQLCQVTVPNCVIIDHPRRWEKLGEKIGIAMQAPKVVVLSILFWNFHLCRRMHDNIFLGDHQVRPAYPKFIYWSKKLINWLFSARKCWKKRFSIEELPFYISRSNSCERQSIKKVWHVKYGLVWFDFWMQCHSTFIFHITI